MDNQHRKITGYRELSEAEIEAMNAIKFHAEEVGKHIDKLEHMLAYPEGFKPDGRWLAIGKTQLQQGFMAVTRAVAKPETF